MTKKPDRFVFLAVLLIATLLIATLVVWIGTIELVQGADFKTESGAGRSHLARAKVISRAYGGHFRTRSGLLPTL
jgi:hypothetical protein